MGPRVLVGANQASYAGLGRGTAARRHHLGGAICVLHRLGPRPVKQQSKARRWADVTQELMAPTYGDDNPYVSRLRGLAAFRQAKAVPPTTADETASFIRGRESPAARSDTARTRHPAA